MGFWDTVGKAASAASDGIKSHHAKVLELKEEFSDESDEFLKKSLRVALLSRKLQPVHS